VKCVMEDVRLKKRNPDNFRTILTPYTFYEESLKIAVVVLLSCSSCCPLITVSLLPRTLLCGPEILSKLTFMQSEYLRKTVIETTGPAKAAC